MAKYKGMIFYNYYGHKKHTHLIFDVFSQGNKKTCYSKWHNSTYEVLNSDKTSEAKPYSYYKPACRYYTSNYQDPLGFFKNIFLDTIPENTDIYFGDYKNLSGDYSWDSRGYTGSMIFEIFYK